MDDKSGNQFDEEKNRVDGQHDADTGGLWQPHSGV
jgi:hypothetical protein